MDDDKKITHESYGMVGLSRYEGGHEVMFGSSIKHRNGIALRVYTAEWRRDLSNDWYFADRLLIELHLSPSQFAEMITTPNVGHGVPCTIIYAEGSTKEPPPFESKAETYRQEFKASTNRVADEGTLYMKEALDILANKSNISKGDRDTISNAITQLLQHVRSNLPFIQTQFHEQMDKSITEAKAEVEAFVEHKVRSIGLEGIRENAPQLLTD